MIDIRDKKGNIRYSVEVSERSVYHKELMAEEYVLLTFETDRLVNFRKGDYIETEFGRFEIVTVSKPERNTGTDGGWSYEQKFNPAWSKWAFRKMFYNRQKGSEKAWKMVQLPKYFLQILVDNIRDAGFGDWSFTVDASLTEMKLVEFDGTSLLDALMRIAETWETEWWITDNVIHLSRCEYGSPVVFEEGDVVQDMEREDGQDTDYITRLYAFGSTRNIPKDYRKDDDANLVIEGVVERRLKLPVGIDHIDAWEDMQPEDVVEGVVVFDEIYPHRVGTMSDITTKEYTDKVEQEDGSTEYVKWNAYRFKDAGIRFSKEYVIPGEELRITFQDGTLAGMDFAVTFNPDGFAESDSRAQLWEIVRNEDYGTELPSESFKPSNGDKYILYGYNSKLVSEQLIPQAEQELLAKAHETILKKSQDKSIYNCTTDPIRCAGYKERNGKVIYLPSDVVDLDIGQAVELRNEGYFDNGYRISRVRSFEKRLDNRYNCTYTVGESAGYSNSAALEEKVEAITYQNTQLVSTGSGIYVIKRYDGTIPSDHNVFSARRSLATLLRKDKTDQTNYLLKLLGGIISPYLESPDFVPGAMGAGYTIKTNADGQSYAEVDKLLVRMKAVFQTLSIMETELAGADFLFNSSGARAKIAKVEVIEKKRLREKGGKPLLLNGGKRAYSSGGTQGSTAYRCYFLTDDGDTAIENRFRPGNLVRSQTFNIKAGVHENVSNHYWWRMVTDTGKDWIELSDVYCDKDSDIPKVDDVMVQLGDTADTDYQSAIALSAYGDGAPSLTFYTGINSYSLSGKDVFTIAYDRLAQECYVKSYGRFYAGDREETNFVKYTKENGMEIKAKRFLFSNGEDIETRIEATEGRISLKLRETGIDIESGNVTVTADKFKVQGANGTPVAVFTNVGGVPKLRAENIDASNLNVTNINGGYGTLGEVTIEKGTIGGFTIKETYLGAIFGENGVHIGTSVIASQRGDRVARIGPDSISATSGAKCVGYFSDTTTPYSSFNVGLWIDVNGADSYNDLVASGNHALYIQNGYISGFRLKTRRISSSTALSNMDNIIIATAKDITLTMPTISSEQDGHVIFIRNYTDGSIGITGTISNKGNTESSYKTVSLAAGDLAIMIYDSISKVWLFNSQ